MCAYSRWPLILQSDFLLREISASYNCRLCPTTALVRLSSSLLPRGCFPLQYCHDSHWLIEPRWLIAFSCMYRLLVGRSSSLDDWYGCHRLIASELGRELSTHRHWMKVLVWPCSADYSIRNLSDAVHFSGLFDNSLSKFIPRSPCLHFEFSIELAELEFEKDSPRVRSSWCVGRGLRLIQWTDSSCPFWIYLRWKQMLYLLRPELQFDWVVGIQKCLRG